MKLHQTKLKVLFPIIVLVALLTVAVSLRGPAAITGITWGIFTRPDLTKLSLNWGIYDYYEDFVDSPNFAVEHIFINWNDLQKESLNSGVASIVARGRWPLVTIEPLPQTSSQAATLISDINSGLYDSHMAAVCSRLETFHHPVFIRWGHEMEKPSDRYPWANAAPDKFVTAYRRMVNVCRQNLTQGFYVWSPAGDRGLDSYWPGKEYADYIGLSLYVLPQNDWDLYKKVRSFSQAFSEKYDRVTQYDRPIIIAEFGIGGSSQERQSWIYEAASQFSNFPKLKTIVFFNAPDSLGVWDQKYGRPDWKMPADLL